MKQVCRWLFPSDYGYSNTYFYHKFIKLGYPLWEATGT